MKSMISLQESLRENRSMMPSQSNSMGILLLNVNKLEGGGSADKMGITLKLGELNYIKTTATTERIGRGGG